MRRCLALFETLVLIGAPMTHAFGSGSAEVLWTRKLLPEVRRYIGWPTAFRTSKGELLAVFSGDREGHLCPYGKVQLVRSADGGETWSDPKTICDGPIDDRDAGIIELKNGDLVVFWFTSLAFYEYKSVRERYLAHYQALSERTKRESLGSWSRRSTDGGHSWSEPVRVPVMTPHGGVLLKDGRILVAGVRFCGFANDEERAKAKKTERVFEVAESKDGGRSFHTLARIPNGNIRLHWSVSEPSLFEDRHGGLHVYFRNEVAPDGTFDPKKNYPRLMYKSESKDGGKTWTSLAPSEIDGFPPHFLRLKNGDLLCSYASRTLGRIGVYACVSHDDGKTFDVGREYCLARSDNRDMGYPSTVENSDGTLLTVFYAHPKPEATATLMGVKWRMPR